MKLSRKRRRELRHLRGEAQELLDRQRVVLGHAGDVLNEAGHQAKKLSDEHLAPRVESAVEAVRPTVDRGVEAARGAAKQVRVFTAPFVTKALTKAIRTLDDVEGFEAADQVRRFGERAGYLAPTKKSKAGPIVAIGLGIAAAAGVGYVLWQAFRTDDELWVAPESES